MFKLPSSLFSSPVKATAEPTPNSKQIAAVAMKGELWCGATHQGHLYENGRLSLTGVPSNVRAVTVLDANTIASTDRCTVNLACSRGSIVVVGDSKKRKRDPEQFSALTSPSPDRLAIATQEGKIHIWNVKEEKVERKIEAHQQTIRSLSSDKDMLVSAGGEGVVKLWDLRQEAPVWQIGRCGILASVGNATYFDVDESPSKWVYCVEEKTTIWDLGPKVPQWKPDGFSRRVSVAHDQQHVLIGVGTTLFAADLRKPSGWVYSMDHDTQIVGVGTCGEGVFAAAAESGLITFKSPLNEKPVIYDFERALLTVAFGGTTQFLPVFASEEVAQPHKFIDPHAPWFNFF